MDVLSVRDRWMAARVGYDLRAVIGTAARLGVAVGAGAAWGGPDWLLPGVPFVFAAFWRARSRPEAFLVVWTYQVVSTRSLIPGAARFFETPVLLAALVVGAGAIVVALAWAVCWHDPDATVGTARHVVRTFMLLAVTVLPPITSFAVPHPVSAAGVWFPGWGAGGLAAMVLAAGAMRSVRWGVVPWMLIAFAAVARGPAPEVSDRFGVEAEHTSFGASRNELGDYLRQWSVASRAMAQVSASSARVIVLPEGTGGLWSAAMQERWTALSDRLRTEGRTVLVGVTQGSAVEPLAAGVVALGASRAAYRQRVAMPLAMWRPGAAAFAPAWFGSGTLFIHAEGPVRAGVFVCWEIGVVWCVLRSVAEGAEVLIVAANTAWLAGTDAGRAQHQMLAAWGALFGLPTVLAANT